MQRFNSFIAMSLNYDLKVVRYAYHGYNEKWKISGILKEIYEKYYVP